MWRPISRLIYDLSLSAYGTAARVLSGVVGSDKAKKWVKGRSHTFSILEKEVRKEGRYIWFHCASLGEFEQGRPLMEHIKRAFPDYQILLTFFSPSGYDVRKNYAGADIICYLPIDSETNARRLLDLVKPELVFFVKYEFWFHYLTELKRKSIPTLLISSTFRSNQPFFQWYGSLWRDMLSCFSYIFVQDQISLSLLNKIDVTNVDIANDTRFDRVYDVYKASKEFPVIKAFADGNPVLVAGSTWKKDEEILSEYAVNSSPPDRKFIFAPHNINEEGISALVQLLHSNASRYSEIKGKDVPTLKQSLIIDNIGMLSALYGYGDIAYIGGGFGASVHNILEAAVFGMPVIFGPNHTKSVEALDLLKAGGAFCVRDTKDLMHIIGKLTNKEFRLSSGEICRKYVMDRLGGTMIIINYLKSQKLINNL